MEISTLPVLTDKKQKRKYGTSQPYRLPHNLIHKSLILSYLTGSFQPSFIEEYTGGLLMVLQKQDGGIRPILCGEMCRHCFVSLTVNATPVLNESTKLFISTYNFVQTTGIRDGAARFVDFLVSS